MYWVQIKCYYLSLFSYESDEERNINDAITDQFRAILQDVTVYYSKKLDMYRIKMEHHQRTRPDNGHYGGFQLLDLIITELKSHMTC